MRHVLQSIGTGEKGNAVVYTIVRESVNHHGVDKAATRSLFQSFLSHIEPDAWRRTECYLESKGDLC